MNVESNCKGLKLFPIFHSPTLKKQNCDTEHCGKTADKYEKMSEKGTSIANINEGNNNAPMNSCHDMIKKPLRGRSRVVKTSKNERKDKSLRLNVLQDSVHQDHGLDEQSNLSDITADINDLKCDELSTVDIKLAVREVMDYICTEVQQTDLYNVTNTVRNCSISDTEIEPAAIEVVEYLCSVIPQIVDHKDFQSVSSENDHSSENNLSLSGKYLENDLNVNYIDSDSKLLKPKRKSIQKKSAQCSLRVNSLEVTEVSGRRRSLRCKESIKKNLACSETDLCTGNGVMKKKLKQQQQPTDKENKLHSRMENCLDNFSSEITTFEHQEDPISIATETKGENEKDKPKLFPIFTTHNILHSGASKGKCIVERENTVDEACSNKNLSMLPSDQIASKKEKNEASITHSDKDSYISNCNLTVVTNVDSSKELKNELLVSNDGDYCNLTEIKKYSLINTADSNVCVIKDSCELNSVCIQIDENYTSKKRDVKNSSSIMKQQTSNDLAMTDVTEISDRRKSLRSRWKNKCNNSKTDTFHYIKNQKVEAQILSEDNFSKLEKNVGCNILGLEISITDTPKIDDSELKVNGENAKETSKLFPIFTAKNALHSNGTEEMNFSNKRKKALVENCIENDISIVENEMDTSPKKKKINKKLGRVLNSENSYVCNKNLNIDITSEEKCENKSPVATNFINCIKNSTDNMKVNLGNTGDSNVCIVEDSDGSDLICIGISNEDCNNKTVGRRMKKNGSKIIVNENSVTNSMNSVKEEISSRRKSLRSRGMRNNLINYSEVKASVKNSKDKERSKAEVLKQDIDEENYKGVDYIAVNHKLKTSVIDPTQSSISFDSKAKSKSVKEKVKLFPIFTGQKILHSNMSENKCTLGKRQADIDEEYNESDSDIITKKLSLKTKKPKRKADVSYPEEMDKTVPLVTNNYKDHCKTFTLNERCDLSNETDSEISIIGDYRLDESKNNSKKISLENKSSRLKSNRKLLQLDQDVIPFPILSHLISCSMSLPDTASKFYIDSESLDGDILLPSWNKIMGLTDIACIETIRSSSQPVSKPNSKNILSLSNMHDITPSDNGENSMLWTESMQNLMMKENSNENVIAEIKTWLLQWKNKFCKNDKAKTYDSDSDYSCSDSDHDFISNCIIIYGAPGSGKTSLVFSLANELGYTVLEVNASSCRNGRNISHQLKEALESYHVEGIKLEDLPNKSALGDECRRNLKKTHEFGSYVNKAKNLRNFFTVENKESDQINVKCGKGKLNDANFFQENSDENQLDLKVKRKRTKFKSKEDNQKNKSSKERYKSSDPLHFNTSSKPDKSSCKISSLTIILFDDVDIVFEEDEGFWSTVKGFLKISKKPVVFTVGRNLSVVKAILNSDIKIFNMKPVSKDTAVKKLKNYCKEYPRESSSFDLELLISHNVNDFRRNVLNAQFWTQKPSLIQSPQVEDKITETVYNFIPYSKLVHMNSFLTGDLSFSTNHMRKLLFDNLPHYITNAISQYHSLGYDILHSNLFNILNILKSSTTEYKKIWQTLTVAQQITNSHINVKNATDSHMWQEACELFKLKKMALKNGSCSKELNFFANVLEDFSYSDMLKGPTCKKLQWISMTERIKMWTAGLPICSDHCLWTYEDVLDIISLINVYRLRKYQKVISDKYSETTEDIQLVLEHPFLHFDQSFAYKTEEDLQCISEALPPFLQLNKSALSLDYLSAIKIMCQDEEQRRLSSGKRSGRFLHYFDSVSFLIDRKTF